MGNLVQYREYTVNQQNVSHNGPRPTVDNQLVKRSTQGLDRELFMFKLWASISKVFHLDIHWTGLAHYNTIGLSNEKRTGYDFAIYRDNKLFIAEEDKNGTMPKKPYSRHVADADVNKRFDGSKAEHNLLSASFSGLFASNAVDKDIDIFATDRVIIESDLHDTEFFNLMREKLIEYVQTKITEDENSGLNYLSLSMNNNLSINNYLSLNNTIDDNDNISNSKIKNTIDTPIAESIIINENKLIEINKSDKNT